MNKAHISTKYKNMLELAKDRKVAGVNCYSCSNCGHITKTVDVDAGVTPMMHKCEKCGHMAESSFYNDIAPGVDPTEEWYRPSLEQVLKVRKTQPGLVQHVLNGGLDCRKIQKDNN